MFIAKHFAPIADLGEVITEWFAIMRSKGAVMAGYHLMPALGSPIGERVIVRNFGFPQEFADSYDDPVFRATDPIPAIVFEEGRPLSWSAAVANASFTPAQRAFLAVCFHHGLVEGVSMPLYGPDGREGYLSLAFGHPISKLDMELTLQMQAIAQSAHIRIAKLLEAEFLLHAKLSPREREVLQWLARGKSTGDVATIMNLAADTVGTYTRRIYSKLGVNDRIAAVVVGLTHGLVRF